MHKSTLRAAGGSIAVTIAQALARACSLRVGDRVSIDGDGDGGQIVLTPLTRRTYSLQDLLDMQGDKPFAVDKPWDAMPAVGKEVSL